MVPMVLHNLFKRCYNFIYDWRSASRKCGMRNPLRHLMT